MVKRKSSEVLSTRVPYAVADAFRAMAKAQGKTVTAALAELVEAHVGEQPPAPAPAPQFDMGQGFL